MICHDTCTRKGRINLLDVGAAFNPRRDPYYAKAAIVVACLLLLGGLVSYYFQVQYETVLQEKRELLQHAVSHTEHRINGTLTAVSVLASDVDITSPGNTIRTKEELQRAVKTLGLHNAALFDVNGNLIADAKGIHPPKVNDSTSFAKALGGQPAISNRIVSGDLASAYVSLRVPVYNQSGQVNAVLAAAIPIAELSAIANETQFLEGQYIFIIDGTGQLLHHPRLKDIYPENADYINRALALKGPYGSVVKKASILDNVEKIFIYQPLSHTMWRVSFAVPATTVYFEVLQAAAPSSFVFALLAVIIILIHRNVRQANRSREIANNLRLERLAAATEMASGIAHEVRNPLTSIKGFIQLMMKKQDKSNFNNYLEIVLGEIERIDALIGEFQTLARPLRQPNLVRTDLSKVVSEVIMLMEPHAGQKQVMLEYSLQGELFNEAGLWVKADIPQLKQVLINLIKNAVDAVTAGGRVRITLNRSQDMPAIVIEDNGTGIPQDIINKLGTPFFTTKEGGTGLGLSVCYTIIHNHGGKIDVTSKVGEGTAFTVMFPPLEAAS